MKKIAFDTNIVLDAICNRKDAEVAQALMMEVAEDWAVGVITANAVTDIYYIARKHVGSEPARGAVKNLIALFDVVSVDADICGEAVYSTMDDFEVFTYACERKGVDYIATRDRGLIESQCSPVEAYSPEDVLKLIREE